MVNAAERIMLELELINMEYEILYIKHCNAKGREDVKGEGLFDHLAGGR